MVDRGVLLRPATGERLQDNECRDHGDGKEEVENLPDVLRVHSVEPSEALGRRTGRFDARASSIGVSGAESEKAVAKIKGIDLT